MKRVISMLLVAVMALCLIACGTTEAPATEAATADVAMQYIKADEAKNLLENDEYVFFDIRKAADSSANTIPGARAYDMDAAKEGDAEAGKATMTEATKDLDKKIILVCYSGKRYAQAATNALSAIGYDMSKVYTLEGGFTGWSENLPELTTGYVPAEPEKVAFEGKYVVDAQYVIENLKNENVVLVDARGEEAAANGTVEGAIAVIWQMFADVTSGAPGDEMWGTLLPAEQLSAVLSSTGIAPEKEIIVFGANQFGWGDEGRIVWGLNAAGFENAKFVDGGYVALEAAGAPIVKGAAAYTAADVKVEAIDETHIINTDALVADYDSFVIVDTRADEEWNGEVLYGEAAGGHLPKALHIRYTDLFNEDQTLKSNDEIQAMFTEAGLTTDMTIVTYCTGGIRSAYMQLVLEMLGFENTLNYDESFYRWSACQDCE